MTMPRLLQKKEASSGFSLVELLVALVFTMILMAGMANVFKASMSTFMRTSEGFANSRRNAMSLDMLYDDLNNTGLYLMSLTTYPGALTTAAPGFYVTPNVSYATSGLDTQGTLPANWVYPASTADELYLYFDDPIPFDGTLNTTISSLAAQEAAGTTITDSSTFNIQFADPTSAASVKQGMFVVFRDAWDVKPITSVAPLGTTGVTVTTGQAITTGGYDSASGSPTGASPLSKQSHLSGRNVIVMNAAQQVRYSIKPLALDPSNTTTLIPCLVRDQGPFGGAYDASLTSIIAENVVGFKVFLSADRGTTWAGLGYTTKTAASGDATPWNNTSSGSFRKVLNATLLPRNGVTDTSNPSWFREIPTLVRIDLLTRTMQKRAEYGNQSPSSPTADYGIRGQSLIIVPRHFGLPF